VLNKISGQLRISAAFPRDMGAQWMESWICLQFTHGGEHEDDSLLRYSAV
jgi:hypothetical protein